MLPCDEGQTALAPEPAMESGATVLLGRLLGVVAG